MKIITVVHKMYGMAGSSQYIHSSPIYLTQIYFPRLMSPMLHYKTVICKDFRGLRGTQETRDKYTERVPVNFTPLISCWLVKPNRSFQPFSCLSVKHTSQKHPVGQIQLQYFPNIFLIKKSNLSRNLK